MIIALTGLPQSGKDTFAKILQDELNSKVSDKFKLVTFAKPLKEMLAKAMNVDVNFFENNEFKDKQTDDVEWWFYYSNVFKDPSRVSNISKYAYSQYKDSLHGDSNFKLHKPSNREVMQIFGDLMRSYNKNYFIDVALRGITSKDNIIVTDLRYENELEALKRISDDVVVIEIKRTDSKVQHNNHASNNGISKDNIHFTIKNYIINEDESYISLLKETAKIYAKIYKPYKEAISNENDDNLVIVFDSLYTYHTKKQLIAMFEAKIKFIKTSNMFIKTDLYKKYGYKGYTIEYSNGGLELKEY